MLLMESHERNHILGIAKWNCQLEGKNHSLGINLIEIATHRKSKKYVYRSKIEKQRV
jgi:hypothetical protein